MKRRIFELIVLAIILAVIGAVVVTSGIVPVKASGGHLPGVEWLLEFASERSIATHSLGIEVPPLDEPGLIQLGAIAYQSNCQWCHGSPREPAPVVAAHMLPPPPYLPTVLDQWEPQELFTIVKHGIKFAGMPAWPSQHRDDEVWAVVAFLTQFPSLKQRDYENLVGAEPTEAHVSASATGDQSGMSRTVQGELPAWKNCGGCHGPPGSPSIAALVPSLHRQSAEYLTAAMHAYRSGARVSGIMQPIASRLTSDEIASWIAVYATTESKPNQSSDPSGTSTEIRAEPPAGSVGAELAGQGDAQRKIPACAECHAADARDPTYPSLHGLSASYIATQLKLFADGVRGGPRSDIMHKIADKLSESQRNALAEHYQQELSE